MKRTIRPFAPENLEALSQLAQRQVNEYILRLRQENNCYILR